MVPARNLLRRHYDSYGGGVFADFLLLQEEKSTSLLASSSLMAEEEAQRQQELEQQEAGTNSSRKSEEAAAADDSWLQLGIGSSSTSTAATPSPRSLELDLFSSKPTTTQLTARGSATVTTTVPQPVLMPMPTIFSPQYGFGYRGQLGYWSSTTSSGSLMMGGSSSSSSPRLRHPSQATHQATQYCTNFPQYVGSTSSSSSTTELRVISPPTRRQAGVWFLLQAAKNQVREPFLPQIAKSHLRIKDGSMTVRLVMKYLVNKLGLDDESEVEISCRGQLLLPCMTLQHVRDNIWCLRETTVAILSDSPTDRVMALQYGRSHH